MAIFKVPRINTLNRNNIILEESEVVYDLDLKSLYGGDGLTPGGFLIAQNKNKVLIKETITIDQEILNNKSITLQNIPTDIDDLRLIPDGGIEQRNGLDYEVISNLINFNNFGLDNFFEINDVVFVIYTSYMDWVFAWR